jgi:hypothetical protein
MICTEKLIMFNEIELLAEITEDNLFLRRYPTMKSYVKALRELGVVGDRPTLADYGIFDFYANHIDPEDVAMIKDTYTDNTDLDSYYES